MGAIEVGQPAPSFRLPTGHGSELGTDDYRGRNHLVVWFTKGMACPFCRTQMSQLARGYPRLQAAGAEVLQVTPTRPQRAAFYAKNFPLPFPYLCDPDYAVHRAWGLELRSRSLAWYARTFYTASRLPHPPPSGLGEPKMALRELPGLLHDSDMGFFVVDRQGTVRYRHTSPYAGEHGFNVIPSVDEVVQQLEQCT
jgi:peroxiredoxin